MAGRIYTVRAVLLPGYRQTDDGRRVFRYKTGLSLLFEGMKDDGTSSGASRFRKIRPHTPDEEDRETIALLNGAPVKQPVTASLHDPRSNLTEQAPAPTPPGASTPACRNSAAVAGVGCELPFHSSELRNVR
ncbi:hypothetical protein [Qipengyuania sp. MTN3-11]|uniref:hypothetical protein n=1 Tax=Qipengyuania sp. MTN3-11 TaxID=3056557 RepID=UPI0036F354E8